MNAKQWYQHRVAITAGELSRWSRQSCICRRNCPRWSLFAPFVSLVGGWFDRRRRMASDMFLFWASGSPPCLRVMLALEEKGLGGYPNKLVSFEKQEHKGEDIMKWNPRGQVPTFVHKNHAINESQAICDYLEATFKHQGQKLLPDDSVALGQVLQRKYEFFSNLEKKGGELIYYVLLNKSENICQEERQKKQNDFLEELKLWEKYLVENPGGYVVGKELSMADIALFPNLAFYVRVGLNLEKSYPHLAKYYQLMCKRPSVDKIWPPHWKGTEAPKKVFQ